MLASLYYEPLWVFYRGSADADAARGAARPQDRDRQARPGRARVRRASARGERRHGNRQRARADRRHGSAACAAGGYGGCGDVRRRRAVSGGRGGAPRQRASGSCNFSRAEAYQRRFDHITKLTLPAGTVDLALDIPQRRRRADRHRSNARRTRRPGARHHRAAARSGARGPRATRAISRSRANFPNTDPVDIPVSVDADRHHRFGPSLLHRYLPFFFATFIERLIILLVPLIVVIVPLVNLLPQLLRWRMRSRIYRWYGELSLLERDVASRSGDRSDGPMARATLDRIEAAAARVKTPASYASEAYTLREHIALVRRSIVDKARASAGRRIRVMTVRTRFAPSPTGFLHLGGARTALFCWAFARHHGGTFILRIEDTDVERSTPAAVQAILDAMAWLGLDYDEGPFYQMQRMDRYRAVIDDMLARGLAYRDYMTPAELEALRAGADGARREAALRRPLAAGERARQGRRPPASGPVIRFRNPDDGIVAWDDGVKGRIEFANSELDDLVIARSDGTPTYNFCVVVDDLDMRITHVIRGDDHVNNTPRQINMFRALGATPPSYAHVPTVLGEDGAKLSKRHGAVSVMEYEAAGYLPDAMVNFLARIGWAHGDDEIFSRAQLVEWFDARRHQPGAVALQPGQAQLGQPGAHEAHAGGRPRRAFAAVTSRAPGSTLPTGLAPGEVAALLRDRAATLVAMADAARYFYATPQRRRRTRWRRRSTPPIRAALARSARGIRVARLDARGAGRGDEGRALRSMA